MQPAPLQSAAHLKDALAQTGRNLITRKMDERGLTVTALALRFGVSRKHVSNVLNRRAPLTEPFARKLAQELGLDARLLLELRHHGRVVKPLSEIGPFGGVRVIGDINEPWDGDWNWWEDE